MKQKRSEKKSYKQERIEVLFLVKSKKYIGNKDTGREE
jgi:hypothetical protein